MLPVLLLLTSSFAAEVANTLGKSSYRLRRETVNDIAFLGLFWALIIMIGAVAFGAPFHFEVASLPTLGIRLIFEIAFSYTLAEALVRADRSTSGFLQLISLPLLLVVDISLGYHITTLQFIGVGIMFLALILVFRHNPQGRRGAWLPALAGMLAVVTVSLYKYDITHYNSVAAEQIVILSCVMVFFLVVSLRRRQSPFLLLIRPVSGTQAALNGAAVVIQSFAMSMAPASVIMTFKRTFALIWTIVFGGAYFHEHSLRRKASSGILMVIGLALVASPQFMRH